MHRTARLEGTCVCWSLRRKCRHRWSCRRRLSRAHASDLMVAGSPACSYSSVRGSKRGSTFGPGVALPWPLHGLKRQSRPTHAGTLPRAPVLRGMGRPTAMSRIRCTRVWRRALAPWASVRCCRPLHTPLFSFPSLSFIGSGQGPVRDFGTERALVEPLGPNTTNFQNMCPRFTLLTELNLN